MMELDEEHYEKMKKSESYKQLLQANMQAEQAKDIALKNTNMAIQNAGLQGNAYGGTLATNTANSYMTALQQNMSDFHSNINQESENNFAKTQEGLYEASDTKDNYLNALGFMGIKEEIGEDGKSTGKLNFDNYSGGYLDDNGRKAIELAYQTQMQEFNNQEEAEKEANATSADELDNSSIGEKYKNRESISFKTDFGNGKEAEYSMSFNADITKYGGYNRNGSITIGGQKIAIELGKLSSKLGVDANKLPQNAKAGQIVVADGYMLCYNGNNWREVEMRSHDRDQNIKNYAYILYNFGYSKEKATEIFKKMPKEAGGRMAGKSGDKKNVNDTFSKAFDSYSQNS